ncbi:nes [Trypoxylus dichotomus]
MGDMEKEAVSLGLIGNLSALIGTSEPALRVLISLLLGYPIALIHRKYLYGKEPNVQYLYFVLTGLGLGYFNYGNDVFHAVFAVAFTYMTLVLFGGSEIAVALIFIFNMGYLLTGYYYSGTDSYDINWTVPQCVLVLRLIGVVFDLYDGRQPIESLNADGKKIALHKRPAFLEFCGYQFFPTSFLIGPQFSLKRFQEFTKGVYSSQGDLTKPPDSVHYALRRFGAAVMYLILFQVLGLFVSDDYIISEQFDQLPFLKKALLLGVWGRYSLYKYISCWLFAEGGCVLFGLSHNGYNEKGEVLWNGVENVKIAVLENTTQFNHYIQSFNVNTNHWVAHYIYKRLKFLNNRLLSQAGALLFLAIWHGFHTGYYVCFLFEFLVIYLEKDLVTTLKTNTGLWAFLTENAMVSLMIHILLRIYTFVFMGWCLLPFVLLTFDRYWRAYGAVNYMGMILYLPWPILYGPVLKKLIGRKKPRVHTE